MFFFCHLECELVTECKTMIERQCKEEIEQVTEQLCEDVIETVCTLLTQKSLTWFPLPRFLAYVRASGGPPTVLLT